MCPKVEEPSTLSSLQYEEREPFVTAFGETDGERHYHDYLQWKQKHSLDHHDSKEEAEEMASILKDDKALWEFCLAKACHIHHQHVKGEDENDNSSGAAVAGEGGRDDHDHPHHHNRRQIKDKKHHTFHHHHHRYNAFHKKKKEHHQDIPVSKDQVLFAPKQDGGCEDYIKCKNGHRILLVLPARLDNLKEHGEIYISTVAMFMYYVAVWKQPERETTSAASQKQEQAPSKHNHSENINKQVTILLDCRGGHGWPNIHALQMVGFLRTLMQRLYPLFPEVLHTCVTYPVPRVIIWMWKGIMRPFLPKIVVEPLMIPSQQQWTSMSPKNKWNSSRQYANLILLCHHMRRMMMSRSRKP